MGQLKCKWNWWGSGHQVWYDGSSFETLLTTFPIQFIENFNGNSGGDIFDGTLKWATVDVGTDNTVAIVADADQFLLHLGATNEAQDSVLYHGDNKTFDVGNGLIFEAAVDMAVAPGTGVRAVFGMVGDHNLDKDAITEQAMFSFDASMIPACETDDTTNDLSATSGHTCVAGNRDIFRIDFTVLSDVKFFINGNRVAAGTTFDMSNLSAAEKKMQPYFSLDKASGTGLGDINVEYVKIFSNRS